ncbi:PIR protein [Plasmodium vivax]|nr:PIR protein [Plasmodium vivax]
MRIIFPGCEAKNSWCACLLYIALITKYDVFDYLDVYENLDYQISTKYVSYQEATFCDNVDFDKNSNFELRKIYYCDKFKAEYKLRDKIFPIDKKSFYDMSTLYKLYKKYHEEKGKKDIKCIDLPNDWKNEYNTCLYKCYLHGNKRLCDAIKRFRDNYETNKSTIKPACNRDERNPLPDITWLELSNFIYPGCKKIGYKLTEDTPYSSATGLSMITHEQLKNPITLQYNLLFENDENEKNCTMMKILHGFLQYFNANKSYSEIITFSKEFFKYYYVKNKEDYKKIFAECSTETNIKEYCTWYNKCNEEISGNLADFGNNLGTSLEEKVESIRKSSYEYSFMENIMSLINDHANISTTMPTLICTLLILFLSSFFLYKFTPIGSWLCKKRKKNEKTSRKVRKVKIQDSLENIADFENIYPKNMRIRLKYHNM